MDGGPKVMNVNFEERLNLERRITRNEEHLIALHSDVTEIKKNLRWLTGIVFSLNTTIIGILTKGFGLI